MRKLLLTAVFLPSFLLGQNVGTTTLSFASLTTPQGTGTVLSQPTTYSPIGQPGLTAQQLSEIWQSVTKSQITAPPGAILVMSDSNIGRMLSGNVIPFGSTSLSAQPVETVQGIYAVQPITSIQNKDWGTVLSSNGPYITQLDADNVNIYRSDYSASATLTTTGLNGAVSFNLLTRSNDNPNNMVGSYRIYQGPDKVFSIAVDSLGAKIGWNTYAGNTLSLDASHIVTGGEIHAGSFISTSTGFFASDGDPHPLVPVGTLASFCSSHAAQTTIMIDNQFSGIGSAAGIKFNANGSAGSLFSYANGDASINNSGTLQLESNNSHGLIFNAIGASSESSVSIRFYINTQERGRFTNMGDFLVGTNTSEPSSILTVESKSKGVLFPRMTTQEMRAIPHPAEGLVIYNLSVHELCIFDGTQWKIEPSRPLDEI